jgi:hypothetical protein
MTTSEIANINPKLKMWYGLDEAILCFAKKIDGGPTIFYNNEGELSLNLYKDEDSEGDDEETIDYWDRKEYHGIVVYDETKALKILVNEMEITEADVEEGETIESTKEFLALEHFDYNIRGGYLGPLTPISVTLAD